MFFLKNKQTSGEREDSKCESSQARFDHLLIVFGNVAGVTESANADESMKFSGEGSNEMFDIW